MNNVQDLLRKYRGLVESLGGIEEQVFGQRGVFSVHGLLAGLYAYTAGLRAGLDAEALFVATVLNEATRLLERRIGDVCPRRRGELLVEALRGAGYPEELVERVKRVLDDPLAARIVVDAASLAKLSLPGFVGLVYSRIARGSDLLAGFLEAVSKELTAIQNLGCLLGTSTTRELGEELARQLSETITQGIRSLEGLGVPIRLTEKRVGSHIVVVAEPGHCPRCGHELETREETNPGCGGLRKTYRCPNCGWEMRVTVCPPPPCRQEEKQS